VTAGRPGGRTAGLAALLILAVGPSGRPAVAQQVAPNRALAYLFPTDIDDARAIWVNPAGLAVKREASIYAEVGVGDPGAKGRLRQINAGFNSGGFSFGYQRDILDNGARGSTYRIGIAGGTPAGDLAAGIDVARYEGGGTHATGWEFGIRYVALPGLATALVATNVGQPIVRGLVQKLTFVPGLTWHPGPLQALGVSADARITPDSVASYAFGLSWQIGAASRWPLGLIARLDTDRGLRRGAFAFGFSIGGQDRGGLVATTPGDVSGIDEASLYGVSRREPSSNRP
jgi:hypothetical protein